MLVEAPSGFQSLSLSTPILSALQRANYFEPTPIQSALIPHALERLDVIGQAQTGTGKTAAFLLPFLDSWRDMHEPGPQAIVLAPTRELVIQVGDEARKLAPSRNCKIVAIYGGQRLGTQISAMRQGFNIAVGTPGRVLDHLARGTLQLNRVRYVVLDEADRMLDIGFRPDIERILRRCPSQRQTLLLSATMPAPVLKLAQRYMRDPVHVNLSPDRITVDNIRQFYFTVDQDKKFELLLRLMHREKPRQCIIFCERKRGADLLYRHMCKYSKRVATMHGDLPQPQREKIMQDFRNGRIIYLVATDVVGRGIDVTNISHIVNYDLPEDIENYVHRIGRTGRMGADGVAFAFVTVEQGELLTRIENYINMEITPDRIPGFVSFTPRSSAAAAPKAYTPVFGDRLRRYSRRI
jgi:ATP-dependent RNA helicase DeaD